MADNERGALFRKSVANQHSRVTYAELLFDLVFVFAVTQISHTLLGRFTPLGAIQTTLLFLSVWWVWVYTSWITNWLNPELGSGPVVSADARRARALNLDSQSL
jgi:low temperature requirement protein LtrA